MRLTLRTMLAYLDGILTPEDAQDIGRKIEESPFASDLIHRIRDLLRRGAESPSGMTSTGPSLGPNAVAEYLDNTLPPEKVPEFEKICLESDVYLSEVAACHQVLTLILGEPAEIDPASRQRMYEIGPQMAAAERMRADDVDSDMVLPPPSPGALATGIDADAMRRTRAKPIIPEYLREPPKKYRWVSITIASSAVVLLAIMFLFAVGSFEPGTTLGNMLVHIGLVSDKQQIAGATPEADTQPSKPKSQTDATRIVEEKAAETKTKPADRSEAKDTAAAQQMPEAALPPGGEQTTAQAPVQDETATAAASERSDDRSANQAADGTQASPESGASAKSASAPPAADESRIATPASQEPGKTSAEPTGGEPAANTVAAADVKPVEAKSVASSERVGRYMSEEQILLRNIGTVNDWQRVPSEEFISAAQQLLVPPTYTAKITIGVDINLRMLGGTLLELVPADAKEPAGVKIRFGRIVARPLANAGARMRMAIGQRTGVITFMEPDAKVALEVRRVQTPGADPQAEPALLTGEFFITTGHALWDEAGQKTLEIAAPARFTLNAQLPPEVAASKEFPKWIDPEPASIKDLDHRASAIIAQALLDAPPDRPAQRGLMELADKDRRKEVRWLAIRCLGYLGYFDPMVTVLDDPDYKLEWDNYIDQLREAVARDPDTAAAVRKSLENRYPKTAAAMYRMLCGYTDKNLASGDDEKLVSFLEDENLALRVLSIWNLKDITGKTLGYQAEQLPGKRQQSTQTWKQRLKGNEIRNKPVEGKAGGAAA